VSFCALVAADGQIFTSTNPFEAAPDSPKTSPGQKKTKKRGPKRPRTTIAFLRFPSKRALREHRARVMARFFAKGPVRRFQCQVRALGGTKPRAASRSRFHRCRSPWRFPVAKGNYTLRIRAVGTTGLRGPAAAKRFYIDKDCLHTTRLACLGGSGE